MSDFPFVEGGDNGVELDGAGPWRHAGGGAILGGRGWLIAQVNLHNPAASPDLIAEAGTVYHETGLTPRQLADSRSEISALLASAIMALEGCYDALKLVNDFGTATGENPDIQNRALDAANQFFILFGGK